MTVNYKKLIQEEEKNTIAIDFDGVIHSFELGFHDGTIYGTPIEGAIESIKKLSQKYKLVLYTAKAKSDRPLVNGKTGKELVLDWLKKYNIDHYFNDVTAEKPRCICYIDDKAINFKNWDQAMKDLEDFINESF